MKLLYANVNSLLNKLSELRIIVFENDIDIICITETAMMRLTLLTSSHLEFTETNSGADKLFTPTSS